MGMMSWFARTTTNASDDNASRMKVAIVGLTHGHVGGFFARISEHPDVQLVAIVEPDGALWQKYMKPYSFPESLFFKNEMEMMESRHPDVMVVYTSIAEHRRVIEVAAKYGVSVMVEKPLTISLDDALEIRRIAREKKIHVLVNYETTWYASNKAAYDEVHEGRIGEIRRVVVHDGHPGPKEVNISPEFFRWLTDPAKNGAGALYDFGCYGADLMTWLMDGETPDSVTAVVNHDKPQIYPHVDDDATIVLQYPKAQAVLQASWNWPFDRKDMEVYGATGYAITVAATQVRLRHKGETEEQMITVPPLTGSEGDSFSYLAGVLRGKIVPTGDLSALDTNVIVMQILDAARESVRTGRTVRLAKLED